MNEIIIPGRGEPVTASNLIAVERQLAAVLSEVDDIDKLEEWRARARALEGYLRDKELQGPMLGAQRRIEARIGQLLPAQQGKQLIGHSLQVAADDRVDFRVLAHGLNGRCNLEDNEWRKSRRSLVSLVRNRLGVLPELEPLPEGSFRCIVADPPWPQTTGPNIWGSREAGNQSLDYETMSVERIREMPVSERAADDAHLYLWTINRYVEQTYEVARAWGFKPSVLLVWAKTPHGVGLGDAYRLTTEFVLYARRGGLKENKIIETTWFNWPRGVHSKKPEEFYQMAEAMTPGDERLELFARQHRAGWTVWGDEVNE